jgi:hypothetical protein
VAAVRFPSTSMQTSFAPGLTTGFGQTNASARYA